MPTREQVDAVIDWADPAARGPILVAATAGLRRGEVFALTWCDVNFEKRLLRIRASNSDGTITSTKTVAGERLVPMFGSLRKVLLELRAASRYRTDADSSSPTSSQADPAEQLHHSRRGLTCGREPDCWCKSTAVGRLLRWYTPARMHKPVSPDRKRALA